jgi:hypothetical protein
MVAKETAWRSPFADVVFESIGKLLLSFHTMHITHEGGASTKELSHGRAVIDGRSIGIYGICGDIFISTWRVESRVG